MLISDLLSRALRSQYPAVYARPSAYAVRDGAGNGYARSKRGFMGARRGRRNMAGEHRDTSRDRIGGGRAGAAASPGDGGDAATWVIKGKGFGHGVGMSQYGAYGLARHGHGYRSILGHYYQHTRVGPRLRRPDPGQARRGSRVGRVQEGDKACGKRLDRRHALPLCASRVGGQAARLGRAQARELRACRAPLRAGGRSGSAGRGVYRGRLRVKASGGGLLVTNVVGLDGYAKGVVANEMPSSWSQAALRAQAVAARSFALAIGGGGAFDVYDDTRSQVYGGQGVGDPPHEQGLQPNQAPGRPLPQARRHHLLLLDIRRPDRERPVRLPGRQPGALPEERQGPLRPHFPYHSWTVRYSQREMRSRLAGCSRAGCARSTC